MPIRTSKNTKTVNDALSLYLNTGIRAAVEHYRDAVWAIFMRILETTPQWSGRAVANWNIGIDAPDMSYDPSAGNDPDIKTSKEGKEYLAFAALHKGDPLWIAYAIANNQYKIKLIKLTSKVFITNSAKGDTDGGKSGQYYVESLQDAKYWYAKLRDENKPYETVDEVLINKSWRQHLSPEVRKLRRQLIS